MINYSYEFPSLLILLVVSSALWRRRKSGFSSSELFLKCIAANILLACSDLIAAITIMHAASLPLWVNMVSNTVYFAMTYVTIGVYTVYIIEQIISYSDDKNAYRNFIKIYKLICVFCLVLLICNFWSGIIFYFDRSGSYCRGPLWFLGYLLLSYSAVATIFISERAYGLANNPFAKLWAYIVPAIFIMGLYKLWAIDANIESLIGAVTGLLIFINFQTSTIETDPLTKLRNLSAFNEMIRYEYKENKNFQVILVSLRDFGLVNSTLGYSGGNAILCQIAAWLSSFYQNTADNREYELFRYGPVSFAVILRADLEPGTAVHKLIDSFPSSWKYEDNQLHISSYFVDYIREFGVNDPYRVVEALDFAKKELRKTTLDHVHFNEELANKLDQRKKLIEYLKTSISTKRFQVYLQPIYSREDRGFTSAEALLRLKDEDGRFLSPEIFAAVAEENMLDVQINHQIIDTVCSFLGRYPNLPVRSVSINLTVRQLQDLNFADELLNTMKKYSVPDGRIALEVTERIMLSNDSNVQLSLFKLRLAGFILLLDDFGTGYSNFSSLLRCRFDKIKLDKSLLMTKERKDIDIVATLINLFHSNGQLVVVEGAETEEQRDTLMKLGADFIQGYVFSKPLPMDEYVEFIMKSKGTEFIYI